MTSPTDFEESVAVMKSAKAMSSFAGYVMSLDSSLTYVEAIILASKIVQCLPILFDANPEAIEAMMEAIKKAGGEKN